VLNGVQILRADPEAVRSPNSPGQSLITHGGPSCTERVVDGTVRDDEPPRCPNRLIGGPGDYGPVA